MSAPRTLHKELCLAARVVLVFVVVLAWGAVSAAHAEGDTLYGALVLATKAEHPNQVPPELKTQAENLKTVFGYNEFRILGQDRKTVVTGTENWSVVSRKFSLHVDTKNPVLNGYALGLALLRDEQVIVSADVKLSRERPLYIRGPFVGEGQLIILLMVL